MSQMHATARNIDLDDCFGIDLGGTTGQFWCRGECESVRYDGDFTDLAGSDKETVLTFVHRHLKRLEAGQTPRAIGLALSCRMIRNASGEGRSIPLPNSKFAALAGDITSLERELSMNWSATVTILNDAEAMAASVLYYAGEMFQNMLVVTLGTSVGVSFIFNGQLYVGPYTSMASHMILDPNGASCDVADHRGCWKTLAGGRARLELAESIGLKDRDGSWDSEKIARAHADTACRLKVERFFELYADGVARGIAAIVGAVPVDCVILSGGVTKAGDLLLGPLRSRLKRGDILDRSIAEYVDVRIESHASAGHGAALVASSR